MPKAAYDGSKKPWRDAMANSAAAGGTRIKKSPGLSLFMWGNDDAPGRDKYRLMIEGAKFFDRNGFEAVWTPERHFHAFGGPYPNPSVTGAALASVTERIGIRAGSCVSPLHHPIRIAEEWAVVDNLSNGRVALAFASGWQLNDFVLQPENYAQNKNVMLEQIDQVRRLWRGEKMAFRNPNGEEVAVQTLPRPVQAELPFWITTAGNTETYRRAGALGANVLTHLLGQTVEEVGEKIALYRRARAEAGHDPATGQVTLMLHTFVGDNDDLVRDVVCQPLKNYLRSSFKLMVQLAGSIAIFKHPDGKPVNPEEAALRNLSEAETEAMLDVAFERYFETSGLFGTPATCARMVKRCYEAGIDEIACLLDFGIPTRQILESLDHLNSLRQLAEAGPLAEKASAPLDVTSGTGAGSHIFSFLAKLRDCDIQVAADGDRLRCNAPPGALTPQLREELQKRKKEILKFLNSAGELAREQRAIVPLRAGGARTPVFAVPGHNGDVFCYRSLTRHLEDDQPFFGLQPPGLDGLEQPLERVEDLAAYFAKQIREFRPEGPYVIAGYCSGGGIAFELARQLARDGSQIDLLALFGCPFPTWYRWKAQSRVTLQWQMKRLARHARALMALPLKEKWGYVSERLRYLGKRGSNRNGTTTTEPLLEVREKVGQATIAAVRQYQPASFQGRVCLILPRHDWLLPGSLQSKWRKVAPNTEMYSIPNDSDGDTMLREPHAAACAKLFSDCLNLEPRHPLPAPAPKAGTSKSGLPPHLHKASLEKAGKA